MEVEPLSGCKKVKRSFEDALQPPLMDTLHSQSKAKKRQIKVEDTVQETQGTSSGDRDKLDTTSSEDAAKLQNMLNRLNKLMNKSTDDSNTEVHPESHAAGTSTSNEIHRSSGTGNVKSSPKSPKIKAFPITKKVKKHRKSSAKQGTDDLSDGEGCLQIDEDEVRPKSKWTDPNVRPKPRWMLPKAEKPQKPKVSKKKITTTDATEGSSSQTQSIYLSEQSSAGTLRKRKMKHKSQSEDGVPKKKKRTRAATGYNLYVKSMRKDIGEKHSELGFAGVSRLMGEMWNSLTKHNKQMWQKKAKMMKKGGRGSGGVGRGRGSKLISTGGAAEARLKSSPVKARRTSGQQQHKLIGLQRLADSVSNMSTEPIDIAAYLKLLGESMTLIGNRLMERKNTNVQGTVSVLLDSALCALGPMTCLLSKHPLVGDAVTRNDMQRILDGMAYYMPGI